MTHQTPPPNNLKIKLKLSKIRKKKAKKADKTNVLLYYSTSLCCLFGSFLLKVNLRLGLLLRENLKTPHRRTSAGKIPASTFCTILCQPVVWIKTLTQSVKSCHLLEKTAIW